MTKNRNPRRRRERFLRSDFESLICLGFGISYLVLCLGCRSGDEARPPDRTPPEPTQGLVKLSEAAQQRAGLRTAKLSRQSVRESLTLTGWLATAPGREVVVRAPVAGTLLAGGEGEREKGRKGEEDKGRREKGVGSVSSSPLLPFSSSLPPPATNPPPPKPGLTVSAGQTLGSLDVFLAPLDLAQTAAGIAEAALASRQAQVAMRFAEAQLDRLKKAPGAVPASKLADLEETVARSRVALEEAQKKRRLLPEDGPDGSLRWKTVPLSTPIAGRVTAVHVAPGQRVAAGDPLWTVADWSSLWVRVPVFEGDLPRIDPKAQVRVATGDGKTDFQSVVVGATVALSPQGGGTTATPTDRTDSQSVLLPESVLAKPTDVPRSANVGQRTVELVYELDNPAGRYYPGQAVTVTAYLGSKAERIVVPASAILWEGTTRATCYVRAGDDEFVRRAIELGPPAEGGFVAERGLAAGDEVVTVGSETLRGEEFKGNIPAKED
jgi:membrane fusion protein, heavy metal efflux system